MFDFGNRVNGRFLTLLRQLRSPGELGKIKLRGVRFNNHIGWMDADGRLIITGRLKDLIITSGAKNVAPQHVEGALKMSPLIDEAMVFGDRRRYIVALLDLQPEALEALAREVDLPSEDRAALVAHPSVRQAIQREVDMANQRLARYEQVRHFDILPERLSVGGGGLSHSLKLEREKVADRYRDRIDALYDE